MNNSGLNLPLSINIVEAEEIRDKKDFMLPKLIKRFFSVLRENHTSMIVRCHLMIYAICIFFIRTSMA